MGACGESGAGALWKNLNWSRQECVSSLDHEECCLMHTGSFKNDAFGIVCELTGFQLAELQMRTNTFTDEARKEAPFKFSEEQVRMKTSESSYQV